MYNINENDDDDDADADADYIKTAEIIDKKWECSGTKKTYDDTHVIASFCWWFYSLFTWLQHADATFQLNSITNNDDYWCCCCSCCSCCCSRRMGRGAFRMCKTFVTWIILHYSEPIDRQPALLQSPGGPFPLTIIWPFLIAAFAHGGKCKITLPSLMHAHGLINETATSMSPFDVSETGRKNWQL